MNCRADPGISGAPADVARQRGINIRIGWLGISREQRRSRHDLAALAVPTLRDVEADPGCLYSLTRLSGQPLNGSDALTRNCRDRGDAGPRGLTVDVHRTSAAQRHSAAELRAGELEMVTDSPQQRHVGIDI